MVCKNSNRSSSRLDALLTEMADSSVTRFVWLRQFEVGPTSAGSTRLLDRLEFLQNMAVARTGPSGAPPPRHAPTTNQAPPRPGAPPPPQARGAAGAPRAPGVLLGRRADRVGPSRATRSLRLVARSKCTSAEAQLSASVLGFGARNSEATTAHYGARQSDA